MIQVLQSWLQGLPDDYRVKDLMNTVYMIQVLQSWLPGLPDDYTVKGSDKHCLYDSGFYSPGCKVLPDDYTVQRF